MNKTQWCSENKNESKQECKYIFFLSYEVVAIEIIGAKRALKPMKTK